MSSVIFVLSLSTFAMLFLIVFVSSSNIFTITLNVTVAIPAVSSFLAGTDTFIPSSKSEIPNVFVPFSSTTVTTPFLISDVPSGTVSLTFTIPDPSPTFVNVIVYSIISCSCKGCFPFSIICSCGFSSLYIIWLVLFAVMFATFVFGDVTSSTLVPSDI